MCRKHKLALLYILVSLSVLFLGGCKAVVLDPKGWVGLSEKNLILTSTFLMLIVVIPVWLMTFWFAWRYRASNKSATYQPDWSYSHKIEFCMWLVPIIIIAILAVITWRSSHELDPYKPLDVPGKPLNIEVVSLDWKWLFIYPEQGIATVNYLALPVNRPIHFKISADGPMNSFMIAQLGGQIYAMPGMQSQLHLIANHTGVYDGRAVNFTGAGFSSMSFKTNVTSNNQFDSWVNQVHRSDKRLTINEYNILNKPSINDPVVEYSFVAKNLFHNIIMQFMMPNMRDKHNNLVVM